MTTPHDHDKPVIPAPAVSQDLPALSQADPVSVTPAPVTSEPEAEISVDAIAPTVPDALVEDKPMVFLQSATLADLDALIKQRIAVLGSDAKFGAQVQARGSYDNLLAQMFNDHSVEAERASQSIDRISDTSLFDARLVKDDKVVLASFLKPRRGSGKGKLVSGAEGRYDMAIRSGQMKRVPLYNSGFFIDIKAADLDQLNYFFNKAHSDTNQYGREFGANFFSFNDLLIKEAMFELISPLVQHSNLRNWNRSFNLIQNIKLLDHKVILLAIAALMFPDGYNFTHLCANPTGTCTHKEEKLIDINKLLRHNYMKLSDKAIEHMARQEEVTPETLAAYQAELSLGERKIRQGKFEFTMQIPSIAAYLEYGRVFNGELLSNTMADNTMDVQRTLIFSFYKVYAPFIASVTLYDDDGEPDVTSTDREVIVDRLAYLQSNDPDRLFLTKLDHFIADSEISHICYPAQPCPECNHVPANGYHTVDPEHVFFIMSLARLAQG